MQLAKISIREGQAVSVRLTKTLRCENCNDMYLTNYKRLSLNQHGLATQHCYLPPRPCSVPPSQPITWSTTSASLTPQAYRTASLPCVSPVPHSSPGPMPPTSSIPPTSPTPSTKPHTWLTTGAPPYTTTGLSHWTVTSNAMSHPHTTPQHAAHLVHNGRASVHHHRPDAGLEGELAGLVVNLV